VSRALRVLAQLLFHRPLILVLLSLVYVVGVFMFIVMDTGKRGMVVAVFVGLATVGLAAVLTERIARHSYQAGSLGLPNHARLMRLTQAWFLGLFVAAPIIAVIALGAGALAATTTLTAAAALGIFLATYGGFWLIVLVLLGKVAPLGDWIMLAPVQGVIVVFGALLIWRWFDLPAQRERMGALQQILLADARHEDTQSDDAAQAPGTDSAVPDPIDTFVASEMERIQSWRTTPSMLALGIGYSVGSKWKHVGWGIVIAIVALFVWHLVHRAQPPALAYWMATGLCCYALVGRLQGVLQAWMSSAVEQSLLRLAPRCPDARSIKKAVVLTTFLVQRGSIAFWAAITALATLLSWIQTSEALLGGTAVFATSLAFSGSAWAVLSHRRIREWRFSTIALVLTVAAGAGTLALGRPLSDQWVFGLVWMVAPPVFALTWYWIAPLRLPLDVDPRALKAAQ